QPMGTPRNALGKSTNNQTLGTPRNALGKSTNNQPWGPRATRRGRAPTTSRRNTTNAPAPHGPAGARATNVGGGPTQARGGGALPLKKKGLRRLELSQSGNSSRALAPSGVRDEFPHTEQGA